MNGGFLQKKEISGSLLATLMVVTFYSLNRSDSWPLGWRSVFLNHGTPSDWIAKGPSHSLVTTIYLVSSMYLVLYRITKVILLSIIIDNYNCMACKVGIIE